MTSSPVLALLNFGHIFYVECNTFEEGIGAVLMQQKQPLPYFSKPLPKSTLSKYAYDKEIMVLVPTIQHWRPYLLGRHFLVYTVVRDTLLM